MPSTQQTMQKTEGTETHKQAETEGGCSKELAEQLERENAAFVLDVRHTLPAKFFHPSSKKVVCPKFVQRFL